MESVQPDDSIILVDGTSLMYRAFYAMPTLTDPEGRVTNAAYGFTNMLLRLMEDYEPEFLAVTFDRGKPKYRLQVYSEYKGHRPDMPEDLRHQFSMTKDVLDALGIAHIEREGVEADDLLGSMAKRFATDGYRVIIVTGDKDMLQVIDDRICVEVTRQGITDTHRYDKEAVIKEYGVTPPRMADMKGLMGDSSDNIPGVPKIGLKRAQRLLKEFKTLEGVLKNVDNIGGKKIPEYIREHADNARMSKELAVIRDDLNIDLSLQDCALSEPDPEKVNETFRELGFDSILQRLDLDQPPEFNSLSKTDDFDLEVMCNAGADDVEELLAMIDHIADNDTLLLDWVMDGESPWEASEFHVSVAFEKSRKGYFLFSLQQDALESLVACMSGGERLRITGHSLKPLLVRSSQQFISDSIFDCRIAAYLLEPSRNAYSLRELAQKYLGKSIPSRAEVLSVEETEQFEDMMNHRLAAISALQEPLNAELESADLMQLFENIEKPLMPLLAFMQVRGIQLDAEVLRQFGQELKQDISEIEKKIWEIAGHEFNVNSPKQLSKVLFDELGLPVIKETKTGYSTDSEVLNELAEEHEIGEMVLNYRKLVKLQGTYVEGLLSEIDSDTGRVHTTFHQCVAATGRLSSSDPNLQNIPIRQKRGRLLRKAFKAPAGWLLLAADYSQIELRILAHFSKDEKLQQAFNQDKDIHVQTAAEVFGVEQSQVTDQMRERAKAVNFGIIYGISGYGLAKNIDTDAEQSQEYIDNYLDRMPGVQRYLDEVVQKARNDGYVRTLMDRIRYLPDLEHRVWHRRQFAERAALNTPIQGTAADIIKKAMVEVQHEIRQAQLDCHLLLQVHDELIWEVPQENLVELAEIAESNMESVIELDVPLKVDLKVGQNWYDMESYGGDS